MNWNEIKIPETLEDIKQVQEKNLSATIKYLNNNSKYYSEIFKKNKIEVSKINNLSDLKKIPPTEKKDLQLFNEKFICVSENEIIDYVTTSGTLSEPVTFILTNNDLERLAYNEFRSLQHANISSSDKVQLTITLDRRFMAGLAYFSGLRKIGAGVVRVGPGNPELQWDTILRIKPNVLIAVPSFVIKLIEYAERKEIDFKKSSIEKIICIGEPIRNQDFTNNAISDKILEKWDVKLFSTYASTEISTAFTECEHAKGGHLIPELAIVESLDENNMEVMDGEPGEITITTLGIEGMPLIRFKTGDIAILHKQKCNCGKNTLRIGPILGRKNHMIKYKGTTLYPQAINDTLNSINKIESYYTQVSTNEIGTDELKIYIFSYQTGQEFENQINETFRAKLRVVPFIKFVSKEEIEKVKFSPTHRKPIDFVDLR